MRLRTAWMTFVLAAAMLPGVSASAGEEDPWPRLKAEHFGERSIQPGEGVIALEAPKRAEDASLVPIGIKDLLPADGERHIDKVYLVIDQNPVPMSAIFDFAPTAAGASIATRVRVDAYTNMRAIAETDDGELYMAKRFVKATGGCSAPAGPESGNNLGEMRLRLRDRGEPLGQAREAQMLLRHPNHTGLAKDPLTHLYTPAKFIHEIDVTYAGKPVLGVESTFSFSENPSLRFSFVPREPGKLTVEAIDTDKQHFQASIPVKPSRQAAAGESG